MKKFTDILFLHRYNCACARTRVIDDRAYAHTRQEALISRKIKRNNNNNKYIHKSKEGKRTTRE